MTIITDSFVLALKLSEHVLCLSLQIVFIGIQNYLNMCYVYHFR